MRIATRLRPHDPQGRETAERFDGPGMSVQITAPAIRHTLHELARIAPRSLPFGEIARNAVAPRGSELETELLDLWLATGGIDLHLVEPSIGDGSSEHPEASPLVRGRAASGGTLTNRWHQDVHLDDPILRQVLALLDGTRNAHDVAAALAGTAGASALDAGERTSLARASIEALASCALLVR
jgi:hypothetical protein